MEQEKGKEVDNTFTTSNNDLEVAQALIVQPTFKLDSAPSPYKVSVALYFLSRSDGDTNCISFHLAGWDGGVGCALDVRCPKRTFPERTVPACTSAPTQTKRRHTDDFVGWRRGNLGQPPRLLHGV